MTRFFPVILIFCFEIGFSQSIGNYLNTRNTGVGYTSINPIAFAFPSWRNTGAFSQDDNRSYPVDIGFDFWYNGIRYTEFSVSTNGFIDFSASAAAGTGTGAYGYLNTAYTSDGTGTWNAIALMYDDLTAQGGVDPLGTSIRYLLSGTAPNRILTVEWVNMAVYLNTTPSLNFQVKLYETTGVIEMNYGTMTPGTPAWSYTCGINGPTLANTPTIAQLKSQQSPNTNTFTNGQVNNLTPIPASNSRITFTPPVPLNPAGALSFSAITSSSMTLNFANWATNEVGYAIYKSTDGVNYFFVSQTLANATSANVTGLLASTTYFWKVIAVTEGALSNALTGSQATIVGGVKISVQTGNWQAGVTWSPPGIPQPGDNVIIDNGHTVTVNQNVDCNSLTVGQGTSGELRMGNNATVRTLEVRGNLIVNTGATFTVNTASNITHRVIVHGNLTNNGSVDLTADAASLANLYFVDPGTKVLDGTGAVNDYNRIIVNMGTSNTNVLDMTCSNFSAINGFLSLRNGTLKVSVSSTLTMTPFGNGGTDTIYSKGKLWMNSATVTVRALNTLGLIGGIQITNGTLNIGDAANENLMVVGGTVTMNGGAMNVAGRYFTNGINNIANFAMTAGTLTLPTVSSTSNIDAPFQISGVGSNFQMSGGSIVIQREGGTGAVDLGYVNTGTSGGSVTGGTLQIGNAATPLAQVMRINSSYPVGNLLINHANATGQLISNDLTVIQDVNIAAGVLNANSKDLTVGGNWTNTGNFISGIDTVFFNGSTGIQTITKATGEFFSQLVFMGGALKQLGGPVSTTRELVINTGATLDVSTSNYNLFVGRNWVNSGTFVPRMGTVEFNGTLASNIGGNTLTTFRNLTINNGGGVWLLAPQNLRGTLLLNNGIFTTTGNDFTLLSDVAGTARIGAITGGDIIGNIVMQRYVPSAPNDWRFIASAVTGTHTLAEWSDDFIMAGFPGSQYPNDPVPSVWTYYEPTPGHKDSGFVAATNITNPVTNGVGYWVYMGPTPLTVDITGPPQKFNYTFPLTFTLTDINDYDGWNHIANPYPSPIDWDASAWINSNVDNEISIWNPGTQTYAQYSGGVPINGGSNIVPSSQGFWVHANAANPILTISENCKSAVDTDFIKLSSQQFTNTYSNILRLTIAGNNYYDETAIRFLSTATDTFDSSYDAHKFWSLSYEVPQIGTNWGGLEYGINCIPMPTQNITIPLGTYVGWSYSGMYTIRRDSSWNLPQSMCVVLEDLLLGTQTDLRSNISYTCFMSDTMTVPRFVLHMGKPLTKSRMNVNCPGGNDGYAVAEGIGSGPWDYTWRDPNNTIIRQVSAIAGPDTLVGVVAGIYTVEVNGNSGICGVLTDTIHILQPGILQVATEVINESCTGMQDGAINVQLVLGGTPPYTYLWSTGNTTQSIQNLTAGSFTLTVTDAANCQLSFPFTLSNTNTVLSSFIASEDTFYLGNGPATCVFSNYSSGYSSFIWDFGDGNTNTNSLNPVHTYTNVGTYQAMLTLSNSACSASSSVQIEVKQKTLGLNESEEGTITISDEGDGIFLLYLNDPIFSDGNISVMDMSGKLILAELENEQKDRSLRIDLSQEAAGAYFIVVRSGAEEQTFKVVKK